MIHVSPWCSEQTLNDIRSISCSCRISTCIDFLPLRQAAIMEPSIVCDDYSQCERTECQIRASKRFHRRLHGTGETFWYCSAEHMQKDRKRCERRNKNLRTKVHQQAAAPQVMITVAPMDSDSTAPVSRQVLSQLSTMMLLISLRASATFPTSWH